MRDLLSARDPDERSAREDAIEFLIEAGVQVTAQPVAALMKAACAMQIGEKTLQRDGVPLGSRPGSSTSALRGCGVRTPSPVWTRRLDTLPLSRLSTRHYLRKHLKRGSVWTRGRVWGSRDACGAVRPRSCRCPRLEPRMPFARRASHGRFAGLTKGSFKSPGSA